MINVLITIFWIYIVMSVMTWVVALACWSCAVEAYKNCRDRGNYKHMRYWFNAVITLGLIWPALIINGTYKAVKVTLTGKVG